ncbi:MAG: hypothetical protein JETCAE02_04430 [Anaerolineaceae bacterium]|nr:hypothetical protein [Anaerolineae bacterium AMX1]NOG76067.1 hypothetical protein [Chloroflexota bacterium]WKZ51301.1 MAG: hypothetical protein QY329_00945 [Anaerolineales bacterium]GJQ38031.1 MAG: hypothetical protein JETCAE02_04430 [Anaerolineaceae bacterium]WKZ54174.1 MAG: hypothetical protein QY324_15260 [Anaerolineales bacterium]
MKTRIGRLVVSTAIALSMLFSGRGPARIKTTLAEGIRPPAPDVIPAEIGVSPITQDVTSIDKWRAEWTVVIYGQGASYTLYVTFGDGGYLNRPGVAPGTYYYTWYYDKAAPKTYNQTWRIIGTGGPAQVNSTVYRKNY